MTARDKHTIILRDHRGVEYHIAPAENCISGIYEMTGTCSEPDLPAVNGFDRGDLLTDIDRQCGDVIERAIHRYLPREAAKGMRRGIIDQLGDAIVRFDEATRAVDSAAPQKAAD